MVRRWTPKEQIMAKTQPKLPGAKPTHRLYCVEGERGKARWIEIGSAWPNRDGEGFSIDCSAMPINGRLVMRRITERPANQQEAA
jgi:hypothetical protein